MPQGCLLGDFGFSHVHSVNRGSYTYARNNGSRSVLRRAMNPEGDTAELLGSLAFLLQEGIFTNIPAVGLLGP